MILYYISTAFYFIIFIIIFGFSAYLSHKSHNPRYIAGWWLGILIHILFPLPFIIETEKGFQFQFNTSGIPLSNLAILFIIEFIFGFLFVWIIEKTSYFPEKIVSIIYCILAYSSIYALLMILLLSSGTVPLFWLNGLIISILFYISFISKNPIDLFELS